MYSCQWYIVCENAKKVNDRMQVDISAVWMNGWICRLKDCHGVMYKKLAGECASIDIGMRGL
jgi:hypothetical protein